MIADKEMRKIAVDQTDDVATTNLMKSTHNWRKYLEKNNTPFTRACDMKDFSCDLDYVERTSSVTDELAES